MGKANGSRTRVEGRGTARCGVLDSNRRSTPYEMFFGERPNLSEMQPFECRALVLTEHRKKLDSKIQTGIFLGYSSRSKCFIVCTEDGTPERKPSKMWPSRNVKFNMDCFQGGVTSVDTDMIHDRCGDHHPL